MYQYSQHQRNSRFLGFEGTNFRDGKIIILEKGTKKSVCASVHNAMQDYADILRVASGIAENFFEEKIAYLKSKNKHLATLRDIEDQIKSDCEFTFA